MYHPITNSPDTWLVRNLLKASLVSSISQQVGTNIEEQACLFLKKQGLHICEQNYSRKTGEIDIIALHQRTLVFVEVRFRASTHYGHAFQTVNRAKQKRIMNTAKLYLQQHKRFQTCACRFDIISASLYNGDLTFEWLQHAFY